MEMVILMAWKKVMRGWSWWVLLVLMWVVLVLQAETSGPNYQGSAIWGLYDLIVFALTVAIPVLKLVAREKPAVEEEKATVAHTR